MIDVIFCLAGILLQLLFILQEHKEHYTAAVILKGCASLMFVLLGFHGLAYATLPGFGRLIAAGLVLGALGDVLLNLRFVLKSIGSKVFLAGIALFLAGHVVYLCAMVPLAKSPLLVGAVGVILAAALLWWILSSVDAKLAFRIFGVFYIGAVTLMAAFAVANWCTLGTLGAGMCGIGAIAFLVSDVVLIFNTFTGSTKFSMRVLNLSLYYLGQLLIAACIQLI